ncbi:MAG: arginine--tRNA ligase [Candidatus Paracaedibacteraceae bacterium]|nr:arginine--tRNA ligase [Candidatus Paracaedibacteraceae bacterium]
MNFFHNILDHIKGFVTDIATTQGISVPDMTKLVVEPTKETSHGDVATNAALILAKSMGMNPRQLAELLSAKLAELPEVSTATLAGPGFVNITFTNPFWIKQLQTILHEGERYGRSGLGAGKAINIEFVSTNPTGPLHAGHGRNAILGDAIASLLQYVGYEVTREYYINDAGGQVNALARSVYLRYVETLGDSVSADDFKEGMYGGDYLVPVGKALVEQFDDRYRGQPEEIWLEPFKEATVTIMMADIKKDLATAGVTMDVYTSEKALVKAGLVDATLKTLESTDDVYVGVLDAPKGMVIDDWEERPQTLFRATKYGDDVDRALKKSDNSWTYFAGDIAYHFDKYQRGFSNMINIFGADHAGYLKRLTAAVCAITQSKAAFEIKVSQMVNFMDNGAPVRMSKRAGTFITFKEVIERVGKDATRYMMVSRHQDMSIDFDFAKVIEQTKENPIFYIQYAHARIHSVIRHMATLDALFSTTMLANVDLSLLKDDAELHVIKTLANWPRLIETAALAREPHRIANSLYDIAGVFHALWNKGKDNTRLRFIDPDHLEVTKARLALIWGVANILKSGLSLLGITAVEEMR